MCVKTIKDAALTEELAEVTNSGCYQCEELERVQNFKVTDTYVDDGAGVYPVLYCHNCNEFLEDGDGDFHHYYVIQNGSVFPKEA